ncbi:FMN-binding protein [Polystyrenella longa]|uniref:FMN-binding protein n=1 Tax=Polystyrenella longa TaxID=2528007 RepID=UPI0018D1FA34|nr:4Fe-4S binding protein [Polystyrenella longa]
MRLYRAVMLGLVLWMMHEHHFQVSRELKRPLDVTEVSQFLPAAERLEIDRSPRNGFYVLDKAGESIGYALSTFPECRELIGYCGPTEVLVVFQNKETSEPSRIDELIPEKPIDWEFDEERIVGFRIRYSEDTKTHVADVRADSWFMSQFNKLSWLEMATLDFKEEQIEGVSGATMTSMNIAYSMQDRMKAILPEDQQATGTRWNWSASEITVILLVCWAVLFSFTRLRRYRSLRLLTQISMIGLLGFWSGDLIAQSLIAGWALNGVPLKLAPGLALVMATAFIFPWGTRRPVYCSHICPHGAVQQMLAAYSPWQIKLRSEVKSGLMWLPPSLLVFVLIVVFLDIPFELAGIEPFDAYLLTAAGLATIFVAIVGLLFSIFVPMGYCKYGCPTGLLLNYVRSHGRADHFQRRDTVALLLVLLAGALMRYSSQLTELFLI